MSAEYVLGHSEDEQRRLQHQGDYLRPLTRDLLVRAGLARGMRVLDFGSGAGDVALLAAELVGPDGEVVAVDRAAEAVDRGRRRAVALGCQNLRFVCGDEGTLAGEAPFDALIGRLVLLHQRDPTATLRTLLTRLRPGAVVAFHEIDIEAGCHAEPEVPLLTQVFDWIVGTFRAGGMPADIGRRLVRAYAELGLVERRVVREGMLESGHEAAVYQFLAQTVRSLLPALLRLGLATEAAVDVETLAERLAGEARTRGACFVPCYLVGATGRVPSSAIQ